MAQFKFDKNSGDLDLTLGGDMGAATPKPVLPPKKAPLSPIPPRQVPPVAQPVAPAQMPVNTPQQPSQPTQTAPANPAPPVAYQPAQQAPAPTVQQPYQAPNPVVQPVQVAPVFIQPAEPVYAPVPQVAPEQFAQPQFAKEPVIPQFQQQPVQQNPYTEQPQQQYAPQQGAYQNQPVPQQQQAPEKLGFFAPRPKKNGNVVTQTAPRRNKQSAFSGKRKVVLYTRMGIAIVLVIISFAGIKSIFFPAQFPTQGQVITVVKDNLGLTNFPVAKANGFVVSFANTYFTYDTDHQSERTDALTKYINSNLLLKTDLNVKAPQINSSGDVDPNAIKNSSQTVVGEPIIADVKSVDDNNAVYTVEVTLSTGSTLYVQIPIYYNDKTQNMAVSAPLSIVPPVKIATVPANNHSITWSNDTTVVSDFQTDLAGYLTAWAASDKAVIERYTTTDATLDATKGLAGTVKFGTIQTLSVEATSKTTVDPKKRQALVTVTWIDANNPLASYTQSYLLNIVQQSDSKWFVQDITGTVISTK